MLGNSTRKYIWINFDENCFYECFLHKNSKMHEDVGLEREYWYAYHMYHINKLMIILLNGYGFDGNIENGGDGLKIDLIQC